MLTLSLITSLAWAAGFGQEPNEFCPVLPDERASERHTLKFRGREVRFCCARCVGEFRTNPAPYVSRLPWPLDQPAAPHFWQNTVLFPVTLGLAAIVCGGLAWRRRSRKAWVAATALAAWAAVASGLTLLASAVIFTEGPEGVNLTSGAGLRVYLMAAVVPLALALSYRMRADLSRGLAWLSGRPLALVAGFPLILVALIAGLLFVGFRSRIEVEQRRNTEEVLAESCRRSVPPDLRPKPAVGGLYYRGNDERAENLFNGGNYLTCTFEISLEDPAGERVSIGDDIRKKDLWVRVVIARAPHTKSELFAAALMEKVFLAKGEDILLGMDRSRPSATAYLKAVTPDWKWETRVMLGPVPPFGTGSGVIYLCDTVETPFLDRLGFGGFFGAAAVPRTQQVLGQAHYGIGYDLACTDGKLIEGSRVWMGALMHTSRYTSPVITYSQWFGHEPIPELPEGWERGLAPKKPPAVK